MKPTGGTRRAQMGIDFLTGMTIFIFTLFFVLQFMFGMIVPYTSTSTEHVGVADRVAERLINQELADENATTGVINHTKTKRFFNKSDETISKALGVPKATGFRLTVTGDDVNYGPMEGLVGYWSFNERSGKRLADAASIGMEGGNEGFIEGSMEMEVAGVMSSSALNFSGSEYVRIPDAPVFDTNKSGEVTLSMWVNLNTSPSNQVGLLDRFNATENHQIYGLAVQPAGGGRPRVVFNDSSTATVTHANALTRGEWNHLAAVYNESASDEVKLYLNASVESTSADFNFSDPGAPILVGNGSIGMGGSEEFDGGIDEVRIYDRALSEEEIEQLYNASAVLSPDEPNVTTHTALKDTTLVAGDTVPDVANLVSRRRVAFVPRHDVEGVEDHVVGPVEVRVQVW